MSDEFIGRGWAFPLRTDATGGIALVSREREIEEAIRLILGTSPGERPMRPEFGCRIHDYVFAPADGATAAAIAAEVRAALQRWEPRIDVDDVVVDVRRRGRRDVLYIDIRYAIKATNDRRNLVFPFYVIPGEEEPMSPDGPARPQPRRPPLPGPRRRRQAARPAALPGVDRPQRVRPGRHADRAVRVDDRPARLPAQPRPGPPLRQVPRAHRRHACSRRPPPGTDVTFWLSAPQPDVVHDPAGTQVATVRTETDEAIVFATIEDLPIIPCVARRAGLDDRRQDAAATTWTALEKGTGVFAASRRCRSPATRCMIGLSEAVPSNAVRLRFERRHRGRRRRPDQPAARLGGVGRRRLGAVRARLRHDRRPQPRRRRRHPRPARPRRRR